MSRSDAILVGEGWISEHYFTTDATKESFRAKILERRAGWDTEENAGRSTPRSRFLAARRKLEIDLATLSELFDPAAASEQSGSRTANEVPGQVFRAVRDILGLDAPGLVVSESGPLSRVSSAGAPGLAPLVVLAALPVAAIEELLARDAVTLGEAVQLTEDGEEIKSAARLLSALFVADDAPEVALVLAGRWALLAERERWAEGRYLAVDLQSVCERNDTTKGGEIDRALTCLCAESIAPDADGKLWWHSVLEASVKHTVGVSQDLRDGVRLSIEIVADEVVARRRAKGLPPLPKPEAQPLARQSLRFLYRILFLLYAEASPELGVLPVGAPEYDQGYSLDRLRELVQVELATPRARAGTHLYESLGVLFRLVDKGHTPAVAEESDTSAAGLIFNPLRADLFRPEATAHIDEVGLGNVAVQQVLAHLLLSKEQRGRDRGFISYAELGINQLGAVYEGLMSYTGFFADTDLYEVAKNGDGSKGSWVVPVDRADGIAATDFVTSIDPATSERRPVLHRQGTFVFRLAGRERQQSASYYTPEVLTRFTVGQALEELLTDDTPAEQILTMTICEPALGSGAFAIEAVRQLADEYLKRRQKELDRRIDPDEYPKRLQEVKAYLALHNVYGVDLNETAVELAEISLWLDTMVEGLSAPWFGLHLRRGNSLIGARRAVYSRSQVADKSWLGEVPQEVPLTRLVEDIDAGKVAADGVHHFLLPADGWGSAADAREAAALAPDAATRLKKWRGSTKTKPTKTQVDAYAELAHRVETLWQIAYRRLSIAEQEIRRLIPVWGVNELPAGGSVQREQIERALADEEGAYPRLRRAMDAWTALWFWPLTDTLATVNGEVIKPPTVTEWIAGLQALLGRNPDVHKRKPVELRFGAGMSWAELGEAERLDLGFASAESIDEVLQKHPWLVVCERIAQRQGFFHWNLDFATVFARGGFDLQVGNPPWVRPRSDIDALLAEGDPWWQLALKPTQAQVAAKRAATLALPGMTEFVVNGTADVLSTAAFVSASAQYPHLVGLQPDLYRCFMEVMWRHGSTRGTIGMIHSNSHFTDEGAGPLRSELYLRLRRHWHFVNELALFEILNKIHFGVTVHGSRQEEPAFTQAGWLYHPDTVMRSLAHDGSGPEPGLKDDDGKWDVRPHASRITRVTDETLRAWHATMETGDVPLWQTRMVYAVNRSSAAVLEKLAKAPRIADLGLRFSAGWHEKNDRTKGYFESEWAVPASWDDVILQGPHLHVSTPLYKSPNPTLISNKDWSATDFEQLPADAIPATAYQPIGDRYDYDCAYTDWGDEDHPDPARDHYRIAWRDMAANQGERTFIPALIPPGPAHVHTVRSAALSSTPQRLAQVLGFFSSLSHDFSVRVAPKSTISPGTVNRLAFTDSPLSPDLTIRTLRLNCVTTADADFWQLCYLDEFVRDTWAGGFEHRRRVPLGSIGQEWTPETPLRIAADRRQALVEIDALVALMLGLTADELCSIYRTQFAVLRGYDRNVYYYDANGRFVPNLVLTVWRKKGDRITAEERTATNQAGHTYTYELPFVILNREADMRQAYAVFEQRLRER
ncbi:Eco57I restriction-modification methylase domain-containing protein [Micromonospora sp. LH3U1]|uniref:Eco57I restriction-modification methylase domain-containing protein n=1 Tax=Micromonospora sp. LH3U1 TaxID=3018339 RepID=UPI00234AF513|nr:class I SAM-dependent DNA methyltransferase [Micromonospora sp. LH3U1]WCN81804.1 class I SAM-dependent DNA methyltransferase [Micromonospora sp. LH3U1]